MPIDNKRAYSLYSWGRLIIDETIILAVSLWVLPRFGIDIQVWLIILSMGGWAVYSFFISSLVTKVIGRVALVGPETIIGLKGTTTTPLIPDGYVRINTELWQAHSTSGDIEIGTEVVILNVSRLTLLVRPYIATFDACQLNE
jgi:membrane-bound ClpP family serine protease